MPLPESNWIALIPFAPVTGMACSVSAQALVNSSGASLFRFVLQADTARIRIPAIGNATRADDLWRHTCFEAFIKPPSTQGYYELNFSPSRQWSIYRFEDYRKGVAPPSIHSPPKIAVRTFADRLELDAIVHLTELTTLQGAPQIQVGLSAVVEDDSGTLSYWALKQALGKADFHWPGGWTLTFPF